MDVKNVVAVCLLSTVAGFFFTCGVTVLKGVV